MPTVTIGDTGSNTYTGSHLAEINQADPTTPYYDGSQGRVKLGTGANEERSFVEFDLPGAITGPVTVSSATLRVYKTDGNDISGSNLEAYLLRRNPVHNQATWNVYSTGNNWGTAGAKNTTTDIVSPASVTQTGPGTSTGYVALTSATLATDIETAINAAATTIGWVIASTDAFTRIVLAADQAGTAAQRPYLEFTYTAGGGAPYTLTAEQGTYTLTGQASLAQRVMVAGQGSYSLTGQNATLTYTGLNHYTLTAEQGTYAITGSQALADYAMAAASGTYTLTGRDATLTYAGLTNPVLIAESGTYTLTGQTAGKLQTYRVVAAQGFYTLQGFSVVGGTAESQGTGASHVMKISKCFIVSASGRTKWVNYIPIKQVTPGSVGRWDNDSAIEMEILSSVTGLVEWKDYIPVVEVADADSGRWRYDNTGFIPIVGVE